MRPPKERLARASCLAAALLAAACSAPRDRNRAAPADSARPDRGARLVYGIQQEPSRLNPHLEAMLAGSTISRAIHGYLAVVDDSLELRPELLEEVPSLANGGISSDGLRYRYRLREGLRWHDGEPLTSADVAFTLAVVRDERHAVLNRSGYDRIVAVATPDERTFELSLDEPYAPFLMEILIRHPVLPRHLLEEHVGIGFENAPYHRAPVGAGPFRFAEWRPGQSIRLVRDGGHWAGTPSLEEIEFRFIPDTSTLVLELQAGGIDLMEGIDADKRELVDAFPGVSVLVAATNLFEHLDLNHGDGLLTDRRVRRALLLAIDREQICAGVFEGLFVPAHGPVHPRLPWAAAGLERLVRHDPEEAGRLLDEAGWRLGADGRRARGGVPLRLEVSTTSGRRLREVTQQVLQQQLAALGVELVIRNHQSTVLFAPHASNGVLQGGRYQTALYSWVLSIDPNYRVYFHSSQVPPPSGYNHARFRSERADELLEAAERAIDPAERKRLVDALQVELAEQAALVPLYWRQAIIGVDDRLDGLAPHLGDVLTWNVGEWRLR